MALLNSSRLRRTLTLTLSFAVWLVPSAFGNDAYNMSISKTAAGGCAGAQCATIPTLASNSADVPAQNVAITPFATVAVGSGNVTIPSIATDPSGRVYIGNGNALLRVRGAMRTIITVAGASANATPGYADGAANSAMFSGITALASDGVGNIYIADSGNGAIRMFNPETNMVCTIAGRNGSGGTGCGSPWSGSPIAVTISTPLAMAAGNSAGGAPANLIYYSDISSSIYEITPAGITQIAGTGTAGYGGDGGSAKRAQLNLPLGLALDNSGNLYIADSGNNLIREINTSGNMVLVAGLVIGGVPQAGNAGNNVTAVGSPLSNPTGIFIQIDSGQGVPASQLIVVDTGNNMVRQIENGQMSNVLPLQTPSGTPLTVYGVGSIPQGGVGVDVVNRVVVELGSYMDSGAVYVGTAPGALSPTSSTYTAMLTIQQPMTIQSISIPSVFQTSSVGLSVGSITGTGCSIGGSSPIPAGTTCLIPITFKPGRPGFRRAPLVMTYNTGSGTQTTSWGLVGYALAPSLGTPLDVTTFANFSSGGGLGGSNNGTSLTGAAYDSGGNFFVTTGGNNTVWMYNSGLTPQYQQIAGTGVAGYGGDDGLAINAELNNPSGMAEDPAGNLSIADTNNCRIREISFGGLSSTGTIQWSNGTIQTIVGNGTCVSAGDGGSAWNATTAYPKHMTYDVYGNIYFAEDSRVRMIQSQSGIISTVAGGGTSTADGIPATQAQLAGIAAITKDLSGDLYIALGPSGGSKVRKVDTFGYITTLPATLVNPVGVATDDAELVYIADAGASDVVRVDLNNNVSVVAGIPSSPGSGCVTGAAFPTYVMLGPLGPLVSDSRGNILFLSTSSSSSLVCELQYGGISSFSISGTVGKTSSFQTPFYNNGNLPMSWGGISVTQNNGTPSGTFSDVAATSPDCAGASVTSLAIGGSCNFALQFLAPPAQTSAYTGTLRLTDGAFDAPQTVTLDGYSGLAFQYIDFTPPSSVTYGIAPITLSATADSGLPVSFSVLSGPGSVNGNVCVETNANSCTLTITGVGTVVVAANQAGNANYGAAPQATQNVVVKPAPLTVVANSAARAVGASNPALSCTSPTFVSCTITGFVNGDTSAVVSGSATLATTAATSSQVGTYPITFSSESLTAANYTFTFVGGVLEIYNTVQATVPLLLGLSPSTATAGGAGFTLTVNGANFATNLVVLWNGAVRATTYVSSTQLTAAILAQDIANESTSLVTVANPAPNPGTSPAQPLAVMSATPVAKVKTVTVVDAADGSGNHVMTLTGTNFVSGSVVQWNGTSLTTNYVSPWQISAVITSAEFAAPAAPVTVNNAAGTSTPFEVQ